MVPKDIKRIHRKTFPVDDLTCHSVIPLSTLSLVTLNPSKGRYTSGKLFHFAKICFLVSPNELAGAWHRVVGNTKQTTTILELNGIIFLLLKSA